MSRKEEEDENTNTKNIKGINMKKKMKVRSRGLGGAEGLKKWKKAKHKQVMGGG